MKNWERFARFLAFVVLSVVATIAGCASSSRPLARGESVEVTLGPAEKKVVLETDDARYKLALLQIIDSRCPANAKCIWAGELSARIAIERIDLSGVAREITLGESTVPSTEVFGLKFVLASIDERSVTFTVEAPQPR